MQDKEILELYNNRDSRAIDETKERFGLYCQYIAARITGDYCDAEEVENDVYLKLWNSIPPKSPNPLKPYVGVITRRTAIDASLKKHADKRGGNMVEPVYEEMEELLPSEQNLENETLNRIVFKDVLNDFLAGLSQKNRVIFVKRYWFMSGIYTISKECHMKESAVKMALSRMRKELAERLEKEGIWV